MGQARFQIGRAVIGYVVALVFTFNGLLETVIDANMASGGNSFALITCLGGEGTGNLPGQSERAMKCSCSLSCCCANDALSRNSTESDVAYPIASAEHHEAVPVAMTRDFRADYPLHLRSPPGSA